MSYYRPTSAAAAPSPRHAYDPAQRAPRHTVRGRPGGPGGHRVGRAEPVALRVGRRRGPGHRSDVRSDLVNLPLQVTDVGVHRAGNLTIDARLLLGSRGKDIGHMQDLVSFV